MLEFDYKSDELQHNELCANPLPFSAQLNRHGLTPVSPIAIFDGNWVFVSTFNAQTAKEPKRLFHFHLHLDAMLFSAYAFVVFDVE